MPQVKTIENCLLYGDSDQHPRKSKVSDEWIAASLPTPKEMGRLQSGGAADWSWLEREISGVFPITKKIAKQKSIATPQEKSWKLDNLCGNIIDNIMIALSYREFYLG